MTTLWKLPESANKTALTNAAKVRQARDLGTLRKKANEAATWRGHALKWAAPWHGEHRSLQDGHCLICGKDVQINTRPDPNGIDIGGPAVALNCLRVA